MNTVPTRKPPVPFIPWLNPLQSKFPLQVLPFTIFTPAESTFSSQVPAFTKFSLVFLHLQSETSNRKTGTCNPRLRLRKRLKFQKIAPNSKNQFQKSRALHRFLFAEELAGGLDHGVGGESVGFVEVFGEIGGLAELAFHAEGFDLVGDAFAGKGVGNLCAHAADNLVIFDRDEASTGGFDRGADRLEVDVIDKGIVDDGGFDALLAEFPAGFDRFGEKRSATNQDDLAALLKDLGFAPRVFRAFDPMDWVILSADKENVVVGIFAGVSRIRVALDGFVHQGFRFTGAAWGDDMGVRDRAHGGEVSGGLVGCAVRGVLETDVGEDRNDAGLGKRRHGEWKVPFGDAELAESIYDGNEAGFGETSAGADHVRLGDSNFDVAVRKRFLKRRNAGGALNIRGDGINRVAIGSSADGRLGKTGLNLVFLGRRSSGWCGGRLGFLRGFLVLPILAEGLCPGDKFVGRRRARVEFLDPIDDFLAVGEREAMSACGILHRGFDAVALNRFDPKTDREIWIGFGLLDRFLDGEINRREIVAIWNGDDIPAQAAQGLEAALHAEGILGDAAGELRVVIRNDKDKRVHAVFGGKSGNGGESFLRFAFHGGTIGHRDDRDTVAAGDFIGDREALGLGESGTERAVAKEHAFGIKVGFTVAGEFALDAAESFEVVKGHFVETVVSAQGVDAILGVAGVVDEIVGFMPGTALDGEHDGVDGGHDLGEGGRSAPVTGSAAIHGMNVHQGDEGASGTRIGDDDIFTLGVLDLEGVTRLAGSGGEL